MQVKKSFHKKKFKFFKLFFDALFKVLPRTFMYFFKPKKNMDALILNIGQGNAYN